MNFKGLDGKERTLTAEGLISRVIQHELDHLDGILFLSKMSAAERLVHRKKLREMREDNQDKEKGQRAE